MTIDNTPLAIEPATRGERGNSRNLRSWVLGTFLGAVRTVVLVGALGSFSSGIGLLHLIGTLRGGGTLINVDQPTVGRQIRQLQRLGTGTYTMDLVVYAG